MDLDFLEFFELQERKPRTTIMDWEKVMNKVIEVCTKSKALISFSELASLVKQMFPEKQKVYYGEMKSAVERWKKSLPKDKYVVVTGVKQVGGRYRRFVGVFPVEVIQSLKQKG